MAVPQLLKTWTCYSDRSLVMPPGKLLPTVLSTSLGPPEPSRAITLQEPSCYKACTTLTVSGLSQATVAYSTKSLLGRLQTPLTSSQTVPPMLSLLPVAVLSPLPTSPTLVLTESQLLESPPALSPSSLSAVAKCWDWMAQQCLWH